MGLPSLHRPDMSALAGQCPEVATKTPMHVVTDAHLNGSDESGAIPRGALKWPDMEHPAKDTWLELALSRLQHDQTRFSDAYRQHAEPREDKGSKEGNRKTPRSKLKSRAQKSRPPSLCATHPSLYGHRFKSEAVSVTKSQRSYMESSLPVNDGEVWQSPPPWQDYSDAKRMAGYGDPSLPNPTPRMLKVDTRSRQTNVVSPTFLIGLPCGGLVEAAALYE